MKDWQVCQHPARFLDVAYLDHDTVRVEVCRLCGMTWETELKVELTDADR
jgi:hypothetical protein